MNEEITLKHPVEFQGQTINTLNLRRPKVKDMLAAQKTKGSDAEREVAMFANLCEQDPRMIEELEMADYLQLQDTYSGFLS